LQAVTGSAALSEPASAGRANLHIGRLKIRAATTGDPALLRLPQAPDIGLAVQQALAELGLEDDGSVWVIERLRVSAAIDGRYDDLQCARLLGVAIRDAILKILRGQIVHGVHRFQDRAEQLAHFLQDATAGSADKWYHVRYRSLLALPLSQMLTQAIERDRVVALSALERTQESGKLLGIAKALGGEGAGRALEVIAPTSPAATAAVPLGPIIDMLPPPIALRQLPLRVAIFCRTLQLHRLFHSPLLARARATAELSVRQKSGRKHVRGQGSADQQHRFNHDRATLPDDASVGRQTGDLHAQPTRKYGAANASTNSDVTIYDTPYICVLLLWRSVVELGLHRLFDDHADPGRSRLTLAAALSGPAAAIAYHDPALHWLTGYTPAKSERPMPADGALNARFVAHMVDRAAPRVIKSHTRQEGRWCVTEDAASGDWLCVRNISPCSDDVAGIMGADPAEPEDLLPLCPDLRHFGLDRRGAEARAPWAILARAAYSDFGRRLPGLAGSSASWLHRNLLDGWGQVRIDDVAEVRLPEVPLDLVLRMSSTHGLHVQTQHGVAYRLCLPGAD
jgi:hypothetical protein